jgi:hypothetical protein
VSVDAPSMGTDIDTKGTQDTSTTEQAANGDGISALSNTSHTDGLAAGNATESFEMPTIEDHFLPSPPVLTKELTTGTQEAYDIYRAINGFEADGEALELLMDTSAAVANGLITTDHKTNFLVPSPNKQPEITLARPSGAGTKIKFRVPRRCVSTLAPN